MNIEPTGDEYPDAPGEHPDTNLNHGPTFKRGDRVRWLHLGAVYFIDVIVIEDNGLDEYVTVSDGRHPGMHVLADRRRLTVTNPERGG